MKKLLALCLTALLLCGCAHGTTADRATTFYYPKKNYVYSISESVVGSEARECADESTEYLLRLYLLGPTDEHLESLYPQGTRLLEAKESGDALTVTLSDTGNRMTDAAFTLAGACLAQTFWEHFSAFTVRSGDREITLRPDTLVLEDTTATLDNDAKKEDTP